jgi:hypothetical protein
MFEYPIEKLEKILIETLEAAKEKDYCGYSKFDALNSPLLEKISFDNKWLRLFYTQSVNRLPFNVRPFLKVKKERNPKGVALFVISLLLLFERTSEEKYIEEAKILLSWLVKNRSVGYNNFCWGYNFIWQNTIFLQKKNSPNVVVTTTAGESFLKAYRITGVNQFLEYAESVANFLMEDVPVLKENENEKAISYVLTKNNAIVLNINAMAASFLIKVWRETRKEKLKKSAIKLLNYINNRRTNYYAWYYTDPPSLSPIRHDNYHTGFILDALWDFFEETGNEMCLDTYIKGLDFYQKNLFEKDGAPRWMSDEKYPHDIHGAAQGIITFTKASRYNPIYINSALKVAEWSIKHLYRPDRREFSYRRGRFVKWNYSLMRWCNGWMARAISELLTEYSRYEQR